MGPLPLIWAITCEATHPQGQVAVARLLLDHRVDPNLGDPDGRLPLHSAIASRRLDMVTLLLARGADPDRQEPGTAGNRRTPLMEAAAFPEIVQALLEAGADVHARDAWGATALIHAAGGSPWTDWKPAMSAESIRLLVAHGAEVEARDDRGRKVLLACAASAECVAALLEAGADVHARDVTGMTPLIAAAGHAASWVPGQDETTAEVIRLLIEAGADVNARDQEGVTPLIAAVAHHGAGWIGRPRISPDGIRDLILHDADVNARDAGGRTALQAAREHNAAEVVALLQQAGAIE